MDELTFDEKEALIQNSSLTIKDPKTSVEQKLDAIIAVLSARQLI